MLHVNRFWTFIFSVAVSLILLLTVKPYQSWAVSRNIPSRFYGLPVDPDPNKFDWSKRKQQYPVKQYHTLPKPSSAQLPNVQYDFASSIESREDHATRRQRMGQIRATMQRCWSSYKLKAWMADELMPVSGARKTSFGGWAATLVDSLDTLWIMDLKSEFYHAADAAVQIDFSTFEQNEINIFETNIRYLGGFIAAYDLSGDKRLLGKALEVAHLLYAAFDTPNRMPVLRMQLRLAMIPEMPRTPSVDALLAEMGSFTLEMTRLSQITQDPKWYDAAHRIMLHLQEQQHSTALPGMWPVQVNAEELDFKTGNWFSLGAWGDSMYEYLPKMHALLGGSDMYAKMYEDAIATAINYSLFKPMIKNNDEIFMAGGVYVDGGEFSLHPELQHLVCYAGGMFSLGGRLLENYMHIDAGKKLTNGCIWAYDQMRTGVMPEISKIVPCADIECKWNEEEWHKAVLSEATDEDKEHGMDAKAIIERDRLPPGFASIKDRRYMLRPEAIESVFVLYRTGGNATLQEVAWTMFRSIYTHTVTDLANADILDVTNGTAPRGDSMESFWTAETLKYFYLMFSDPDHISLDDYVFNTEAHPFKRPGTKVTGESSRWHWKWR